MAAGTEPPTGPPTLEARLGLLDATALVAGSMIGSGIFIVSADIARRLPAAGWLRPVRAMGGGPPRCGRRLARGQQLVKTRQRTISIRQLRSTTRRQHAQR